MLGLLIGVLVLESAHLTSQSRQGSSGASSAAQFEVTSVKLSPPNALERGVDFRFEGERWRVSGFTLIGVLRRLYPDYALPGRIVGGPSWVSSQRFDIAASAGRSLTQDEQLAAGRRLLSDRLGLELQQETREVPGFVATLARPGQTGSSLKASTSKCTRPVPGLVVQPGWCRSNVEQRGAMTVFHADSWTIDAIMEQVQRWVGTTPIQDQTGLKGLFEVDIEFLTTTASGSPSGDQNSGSPDFVTALREQWGVRLTRQSIPTSVLVISKATLPAPD